MRKTIGGAGIAGAASLALLLPGLPGCDKKVSVSTVIEGSMKDREHGS